MSNFLGKVVLVTGGTSGIGLATVKRFAQEGAHVVATGIVRVESARERMKHWERVCFFDSDVTSLVQMNVLANEIMHMHGRIDVLVSNAGIAPFSPIEALAKEDVERAFAVNAIGPLFLVQKCLPLMSKGARIVFTTSALSHRRMAGCTAYSASKAALSAIVETLALELAPKGIAVNAVCPGPTDTPIHATLGLSEEDGLALMRDVIQRVPEGRYAHPYEIANAILFLASSTSTFMQGAELRVDGGWSP